MTLISSGRPVAGFFAFLTAALLASCGGSSTRPEDMDDTTTTGKIRVSIDATFEPILTSHVDTFQKLYPYARVVPAYKPEEEVMQDLMRDSVRAVVVSRPLRADEEKVFEQLKLVPRTIQIAVDGVAVVVNPANPDSLLTLAQLRDMATGAIKDWSQVRKGSKLGAVRLVFDQNRSSTARYVQDSVTRGVPLTPEAFASESNPKVIEYVASHPNAIGVIGVNWISDIDDTKVQDFLKQVRVVGISASPNPASPDDYVQPFQAYLAQKTYPLRRDVYVISREARSGLATGFSAFLAGRNGQLIFLKSGLVPAYGQVRLVKAKSSTAK